MEAVSVVIVAAIVFIIAAIGIMLFNAGTKSYIKRDEPFILINAKNIESIERTIRRAVKLRPDSAVYVRSCAGESEKDEMKKILEALEAEYERVYIIDIDKYR